MSVANCIYEGSIRHWRADPRREFVHRLALVYLNPDKLPGMLSGAEHRRVPRLVRYRRADYLGDPNVPLGTAVRDTVEAQTGIRPTAGVRVLAQLRSFGHCFNPVSFYYCLDQSEKRLEALVAEVTNTPWGERHAYAMPQSELGSSRLQRSFPKELHVSPFMGMDHTYTCHATTPGETLSVHVESRRQGERVFAATLELRRRELTRAALARTAVRYPPPTLRVLALIYAEALRLKLAGARTFAHPRSVPGARS